MSDPDDPEVDSGLKEYVVEMAITGSCIVIVMAKDDEDAEAKALAGDWETSQLETWEPTEVENCYLNE